MRFSFLMSIFIAVSPSLTTARPTSRATDVQPIAAVYWGTNEASGNTVLAANVLPNGTLVYATAYPTGGLGLHGNPNNGPDGLFSASSIFVHQALDLLAIVNSGSNTVSLFAINPQIPTELQLISTVSSGGDFPNSVVINQAGTLGCVLNTGANNGIQCYSITSDRQMVPISDSWRPLNISQTNPPSGPPGTAGHIFYSEDQSKLIVSVKSVSPTLGHLLLYDILPGNQISANPAIVTASASLPFGSVVVPGRNAILSADPAIGGEVFDLARNISNLIHVPGQGFACWSGYSQKTGNFYLSDPVASRVTELNINQDLKGTVVRDYPLTNGSLNVDMTIFGANGQEWMYLVSPGTRKIDVFALNGPGSATKLPGLDIPTAAPTVTVGLSLQGIANYIIQ